MISLKGFVCATGRFFPVPQPHAARTGESLQWAHQNFMPQLEPTWFEPHVLSQNGYGASRVGKNLHQGNKTSCRSLDGVLKSTFINIFRSGISFFEFFSFRISMPLLYQGHRNAKRKKLKKTYPRMKIVDKDGVLKSTFINIFRSGIIFLEFFSFCISMPLV